MFAARPTWHVWRAYRADNALPPLPALGGAQDASFLATGTGPSELVRPGGSADEALAQLRAALARAREKGLRVSIAGARHSMGGQTRAANGVQLYLSGLTGMRLEPSGDVVWVQAGARFWQLLRYLDARGASVRAAGPNRRAVRRA